MSSLPVSGASAARRHVVVIASAADASVSSRAIAGAVAGARRAIGCVGVRASTRAIADIITALIAIIRTAGARCQVVVIASTRDAGVSLRTFADTVSGTGH